MKLQDAIKLLRMNIQTPCYYTGAHIVTYLAQTIGLHEQCRYKI